MIPEDWKLDQTELACAKSDGHGVWIESIGLGSDKVDDAFNPTDLCWSAELRRFIDAEVINAAAAKAARKALEWARDQLMSYEPNEFKTIEISGGPFDSEHWHIKDHMRTLAGRCFSAKLRELSEEAEA